MFSKRVQTFNAAGLDMAPVKPNFKSFFLAPRIEIYCGFFFLMFDFLIQIQVLKKQVRGWWLECRPLVSIINESLISTEEVE